MYVSSCSETGLSERRILQASERTLWKGTQLKFCNYYVWT